MSRKLSLLRRITLLLILGIIVLASSLSKAMAEGEETPPPPPAKETPQPEKEFTNEDARKEFEAWRAEFKKKNGREPTQKEEEDMVHILAGRLNLERQKKREPAQPPAKDADKDKDKGKDKEPAAGAKISPKEDEREIKWQGESIADCITKTQSAGKKVAYVYLYFRDKDDFPSNYDKTLKNYSENRAVFAKLFVSADKGGNIVERELDDFFAANKLAKQSTGVILDYYGNFVSKIASTAANKITAAIDEGEKKAIETEKKLAKMAEKAAKLEKEAKTADQIKALKDITGLPLKGYPEIKEASDKLAWLEAEARQKYTDIIRKYSQIPEDERNPDATVKELEELLKVYKGLPPADQQSKPTEPQPRTGDRRVGIEKEIKDAIDIIKKGGLPPLPAEAEKKE